MPPALGHGKIRYLEIPATDIRRSAKFYEKGFGWQTHKRGTDAPAFADSIGEVNGTWVLGAPAAIAPGLLIHIMVQLETSDCIRIALVSGSSAG